MSPIKLFLGVVAMLAAVFYLSMIKDDGLETADTSGGVTEGGGGFSIAQIFGGGTVDLMGGDPQQETDPLKLRRPEFYGWKAKHPGVAAFGDNILLLRDVVAGYPRNVNAEQYPAGYRIARFDPSCTPRPLGDGEALANVSTGDGDLWSGLMVLSTRDLVDDNVYWLDQTFRKSAYIRDEQIVGKHDGVPIVDVVLTDTSAPQYLVLQHWLGRVLWNIVPAPGVRIAHIAVIGPGAALNPPPGDYEVQFLSTRAQDDCVPRVARKPRQTWDMYMRVDDSMRREYEEKANRDFAAYDFWFRTHFKRSAEFDVVGFHTTQHVLVGPVPETPIPYRPVAGAEVLVTEADYIFTEPAKQRTAFLMETQLSMLTEAAGGDLSLLKPAAMTRDTVSEPAR